MIVTWILVITGAVIFGTTAHEYKHYFDIKDDSTINEICILNLPYGVDNFAFDRPSGYVRFSSDSLVYSSEFSATLIGFLVSICLVVISCYYLFNFMEFKNEE